MKFLMIGESSSQSAWSHLRRGGAGSEDGDASKIVIGTWSEPIKGREVSQLLTNGRSRGFAKARSMTEGRAFPERGNLLYRPEEFSTVKPPNAANSKYCAQEETSWGEKERSGSDAGLWMFRTPTTNSGTLVSGKRGSGGTDWTLWSAGLIE